MYQYSILLIGGIKIDITTEEVPFVQAALKAKDPCIIIGDKSFAHHQFSAILPKDEADFIEKSNLQIKGFFRCRKYGVIHKIGLSCTCSETGEIDPQLKKLADKSLNQPTQKWLKK